MPINEHFEFNIHTFRKIHKLGKKNSDFISFKLSFTSGISISLMNVIQIIKTCFYNTAVAF